MPFVGMLGGDKIECMAGAWNGEGAPVYNVVSRVNRGAAGQPSLIAPLTSPVTPLLSTDRSPLSPRQLGCSGPWREKLMTEVGKGPEG